MTRNPSPEPLFDLVRKIRKPAKMSELIATCIRTIYQGDPFSCDKNAPPQMPVALYSEVSTREITIANVRCVIYSPKQSNRKPPLMLYMHGGAFVIGSSEDTDYACRKLCNMNQIIVLSVNYRLAPETIFPGALEDCTNVFKFALNDADALGADTTSLYLAGDSAGGNLAMALYFKQRPEAIKGLILFAPWLDMAVEEYDSYNRLASTDLIIDAAFMAYARAAYAPFAEWTNPLASPIFNDPHELPPTFIAIGTADPLVDQTLMLYQQARAADCDKIECVIYSGMPHCFYSFPGLYDEERDCYDKIAAFILKTSSDNPLEDQQKQASDRKSRLHNLTRLSQEFGLYDV